MKEKISGVEGYVVLNEESMEIEIKFEPEYGGYKIWERENWVEAEFDAGNLGWQRGMVVGHEEPIQLTDRKLGEGRYLFYKYLDGSLTSVHKSRLRGWWWTKDVWRRCFAYLR